MFIDSEGLSHASLEERYGIRLADKVQLYAARDTTWIKQGGRWYRTTPEDAASS